MPKLTPLDEEIGLEAPPVTVNPAVATPPPQASFLDTLKAGVGGALAAVDAQVQAQEQATLFGMTPQQSTSNALLRGGLQFGSDLAGVGAAIGSGVPGLDTIGGLSFIASDMMESAAKSVPARAPLPPGSPGAMVAAEKALKFSEEVTQIAPQLAAQIGGAAATGGNPVVFAALGMGPVVGSTYKESRRAGRTEWESKTDAAVAGTITFATERFLPGARFKKILGLDEKSLAKAGSSLVKKLGIDAILGANAEGMQEVLETLFTDLILGWKQNDIERIMRTGVLLEFAPGGAPPSQQAFNRLNALLHEYAVAAAAGAGGGVAASNAVREQYAPRIEDAVADVVEKGLDETLEAAEVLEATPEQQDELLADREADSAPRIKLVPVEEDTDAEAETQEAQAPEAEAEAGVLKSEVEKPKVVGGAVEQKPEVLGPKTKQETVLQTFEKSQVDQGLEIVDRPSAVAPRTRSQKAVAKIAADQGVEVVYVSKPYLLKGKQGHLEVRGAQTADSIILSSSISGKRALLKLFGHEFTHSKEGVPEYKALQEWASSHPAGRRWWNTAAAKAHSRIIGRAPMAQWIKTTEGVQETMAVMVEEGAVRSGFYSALAKSDATLFERFMDFMRRTINKFDLTDKSALGREILKVMKGATKVQSGTKLSATESVPAKALRILEESGGFTINARTGEVPTSGFVVSPYKPREKRSRRLDEAGAQKYIDNNKDLLLADGKEHFGGWKDDDGVIFLDTVVLEPDFRTAVDIGRAAEQISIYHIDTGTVIDIPKTGYPPDPTVRLDARSILEGKVKIPVDREKTKAGVEKPARQYLIGQGLEDYVRDKYGQIDPQNMSPAQREEIIQKMGREIAYAIKTDPTLSRAQGWYDRRVDRMMKILAKVYPELKTDKTAQIHMKVAIAVSSNGSTVELNVPTGAQIYEVWRNTGKLTNVVPVARGGTPIEADKKMQLTKLPRRNEVGKMMLGGTRGQGIRSGLLKFNALVDHFGSAEAVLDKLMTPALAGEVNTDPDLVAAFKKAKLNFGPVGAKVGDSVRYAIIFGPKIGSFFGNLNGFHDTLTMDRWYMRSWGRWIGNIMKRAAGGELVLEKGEPVTNDAPTTFESKLIPEIWSEMLARHKEFGFPELNVDDAQAIIWYFEKRIYKTIGGESQKNKEMAYDEAAAKYIRTLGPAGRLAIKTRTPRAARRVRRGGDETDVSRLWSQSISDEEAAAIIARAAFNPDPRPDLAKVSQDERARALQGAIDEYREGKREVITDAQVHAAAMVRIADNLKAEQDNIMQKGMAGKQLDDVETVIGKMLTDRALMKVVESESDADSVETIMLGLAWRETGTAQAQAFRLRRDQYMTPAQRVAHIFTKAVTGMGPLQEEKIDKLQKLKKKQVAKGKSTEKIDKQIDAVVQVAAKEVTAAVKAAKKVGFTPATAEQIFQDPVKTAKVLRAAQQQKRQTGWKFELYIALILSGPQTNVANFTGNTLQLLNRFATITTEAVLNEVTFRKMGDDAPTLEEARRMFMAGVTGIGPSIANAYRSAKKDMPITQVNIEHAQELAKSKGVPEDQIRSRSKFEQDRFTPALGTHGPTWVRALGRTVRLPGLTLLTAFDELFVSLAFRMHLAGATYAHARREGLKGEALDKRVAEIESEKDHPAQFEAYNEALKVVFRDPGSKLADAGLGIRKWLNKVSGGWLGFLTMPFVNTPERLFAAGLSKTPLVTLPLLYRLTGKRSDAVRLSEDVTNNVIGWAFAIAVYTLLVDWEDEEGRPRITGAVWDEQVGREAPPTTSILIAGKYYNYNRAEPLSVALATTIDSARAAKRAAASEDEDSWLKEMSTLWFTIVKQMQNKTYIRGLGELLEIATDKDKAEYKLPNLISLYASTPVPNLAKQTLRARDPYVRERKTSLNSVKELVAYAMWPSARFAPPPRVDIWGRDVEKVQPDWIGDGAGAFWYNLLVPSWAKEADDITRHNMMFIRYNERARDLGIKPVGIRAAAVVSDRKIKGMGQQAIQFDRDRYHKLLQISGQRLAKEVGALNLDVENPTLEDIKRFRNLRSKIISQERFKLQREIAAEKGWVIDE